MWHRVIVKALAVIATFLGLACLVGADKATSDVAPRSKSVIDAKTKSDRALEEAEASYRKAVLAAKQEYLHELNNAFKAAMKAENLDEAKRIADVKRQVEIDIQFLKAGATSIAANQGWQRVTSVHKDDHIILVAKGWWSLNVKAPEVTTGPDGYNKQHRLFPEGLLIGRIGTQSFEIGAGTEVVAEQDGVLEARPADGGIAVIIHRP
jgi:hypothetical protein